MLLFIFYLSLILILNFIISEIHQFLDSAWAEKHIGPTFGTGFAPRSRSAVRTALPFSTSLPSVKSPHPDNSEAPGHGFPLGPLVNEKTSFFEDVFKELFRSHQLPFDEYWLFTVFQDVVQQVDEGLRRRIPSHVAAVLG